MWLRVLTSMGTLTAVDFVAPRATVAGPARAFFPLIIAYLNSTRHRENPIGDSFIPGPRQQARAMLEARHRCASSIMLREKSGDGDSPYQLRARGLQKSSIIHMLPESVQVEMAKCRPSGDWLTPVPSPPERSSNPDDSPRTFR